MRVTKKTSSDRRLGTQVETTLRPGNVDVRHGVFLETLQAVERKQEEQDIEAKLAELDRAALAFAKSPVYSNLLRYKKLVQRILADLVKDAYQVKARSGFDRYGSRRLYQTISLIDERLQELTEAVLNKHRPVLNLVERLDEIRGLLCDLYR